MPNNIKYAGLGGFIYKSHNGAFKQANFFGRELRVPAYAYSIPRTDGVKVRQYLITTQAIRPPNGNKLWAIMPAERGVSITWDWTDDVDSR